MSRLEQIICDLIVVPLTVVLIVNLIGWVAGNISKKMAPHIASTVIELIPYSSYITWWDITAILFAWIAGVFFSESLNRLVNFFYE